MRKSLKGLPGFAVGLVNVLAGSCGGILAVEFLKKEEKDRAKAHATSIAVILPLTVVSVLTYVSSGMVTLDESLIFILPGMAGSILGAFLMPKIPSKTLGRIFSFFIIYAGIRMLLN